MTEQRLDRVRLLEDRIAAQIGAERALSLWPNKDTPDPRPPLGSFYAPVTPVPPANPAVPPTAPAALRLPLTPV